MGTVVVVNPASAGGRTARQWPEISAALADAGVVVEVRMTSAPGEATVLTRQALHNGADRVVAVGGDGTLNEVVNGFFEPDGGQAVRPGATLGMVPSGTGGDFRRTAGVPLDARAAAALLARGDRRPCDVGRIEFLTSTGSGPRVHHYINIADCGLGGEVVARANASTKWASGRATFAWASVRALMAYGPKPARVTVDGISVLGRMSNVVVANGRYFGGGMLVAPDADLADGLLDVVVLGDIARLRGALSMPRVYRGGHIGRPGILHMRGRVVEVTPLHGARMIFDVEGEQVGAAPARITVLPSAVNLCAPAR